jgi:hypothetical protein
LIIFFPWFSSCIAFSLISYSILLNPEGTQN